MNSFYGRGNVGAEPVIRYTPEGVPVCNLRVMFDKNVRNEAGEFEGRGGVWFTVVCWRELAVQVSELVHKGVRVSVAGTLEDDSYQEKETGKTRFSAYVRAADVSLCLARIESVTWKQSADGDDE